ncbi:hypothetical protein THIBAULT_84 [Mycobacterium phage Thibault]|uniref:Uncharacterized protein n=1 Tax=Mycobacterium phage Thibault TaxID=1052673 RepID=G1FGE9_9CAUD|nr:hypothetical protein CL87_gp084 [Mycobacterium phage Thibault]AEJ94007.1 hypothetical protein THIBAULT_84 [Mycobacterium phage Thibault]AXF51575.1 hypothetical protein CONSTELLA_85 [Mycobacterium phage Constella]
MRNTALLNEVMQFILDYPEAHDQTIFSNAEGTIGCFAGWTCYLAGYDRVLDDFVNVNTPEGPAATGDVAQRVLGLTLDESRDLFLSKNGVADLQLMVADLVAGKPLGSATSYWQKTGH